MKVSIGMVRVMVSMGMVKRVNMVYKSRNSNNSNNSGVYVGIKK